MPSSFSFHILRFFLIQFQVLRVGNHGKYLNVTDSAKDSSMFSEDALKLFLDLMQSGMSSEDDLLIHAGTETKMQTGDPRHHRTSLLLGLFAADTVIIQLAQAAVPNPENLKLDEKETEDME